MTAAPSAPFGAAFLEHPDLFPRRASGERWGRGSVVLDLPGGPYRFTGLTAEQESLVRRRLARCSRADPVGERAATDTLVFRAAASDFRVVDLSGREYEIELDYRADGVSLAGRDLVARLDWTPALKGALWTSARDPEFFFGAFDNYLRVLVAYRLLDGGGALVHSAAVADERGALLFPGRAGAGKSTLARLALASGRQVLSDDLNPLLPGDGATLVAGVPFTGDLTPEELEGSSHPLRAVCRLEKGARDVVQPMGRAEALALMLANAPYVNRDPHRQERLLGNLEALSRRVRRHALTFSLNGGGFPDSL